MPQKKLSSPVVLLRDALKLYREKFTEFISLQVWPMLGLIFLVLIFLLGLASYVFFKGYPLASNLTSILMSLVGLLALIFVVYLAIVIQISLFLLIKEGDNGHKNFKAKLGKIIAVSRQYFWYFIFVNLIVGMMVMLWSILFVIPGIIFSVYYSFAIYALLFEDYRAKSALKRSRELVKDYWWPVFGRLLFLGLIYFVVFALLSIPLLFFYQDETFFVVWQMLLKILQYLTLPVILIYNYLIYKELVEMKGKSAVKKIKHASTGLIIGTLAFVVIFCLLIFVSMLLSSFANLNIYARDAQRVQDVGQIRSALLSYHTLANSYPDKLDFGQPLIYQGKQIATLPTNPLPGDGQCPKNFQYIYLQHPGGQSYELTYCLGGSKVFSNYKSGIYTYQSQ